MRIYVETETPKGDWEMERGFGTHCPLCHNHKIDFAAMNFGVPMYCSNCAAGPPHPPNEGVFYYNSTGTELRNLTASFPAKFSPTLNILSSQLASIVSVHTLREMNCIDWNFYTIIHGWVSQKGWLEYMLYGEPAASKPIIDYDVFAATPEQMSMYVHGLWSPTPEEGTPYIEVSYGATLAKASGIFHSEILPKVNEIAKTKNLTDHQVRFIWTK